MSRELPGGNLADAVRDLPRPSDAGLAAVGASDARDVAEAAAQLSTLAVSQFRELEIEGDFRPDDPMPPAKPPSPEPGYAPPRIRPKGGAPIRR
jgi:hypothetical protein